MADYNIGKGVYIWEPRQIQGGDPQKILQRLKLAGVQSVVIKICDGINVLRGLEPTINLLRANGIRVEGWGYSYNKVDPVKEAQTVAEAVAKYKVTMYLIDVEIEAENNSINSERFIDTLRTLLPNTALGLNTFWNVPGHPLFPWKEYLRRVDFVCPQMYWRREQPVEKLRYSQQTYADIGKRLGYGVNYPLVAGDMYTENGLEPTKEDLLKFLQATETDSTLQGIFMWASDENEVTPALWKVFSAYPWRGVLIPEQPLGWFQAKLSIYIRATPQGAKIGGMVKNQIAPIWYLENGWAAINKEKTEWVFVNNPLYTLVETDPPPPPPPPPPGLYKAMVISGTGLKVREAPLGVQVGALKYKEIIEVYEEKDGWARVEKDKNYWVNARYLKRI